MALRNVISTNAGSDVSEEYADAVEALVDGETSVRETYSRDEVGQKEYRIRVVSYPQPGTGEPVWAVDYNDPSSRELEETGTREEAEERYEELVRIDAQNLSEDLDGCPEVFDGTDVPGVPGYLGIRYDIEASTDGEIWQTCVSDGEDLETADGRGHDEHGEPTWSDPHQEAAQEILDNWLRDQDEATVLDQDAVERVLDANGSLRLESAGRPVTAVRVRVYSADPDPQETQEVPDIDGEAIGHLTPRT